MSVTVIGLGGRAGNAAPEEVVMSLKHLYKTELAVKTDMFREVAEYVSRAAHWELPAWKAIVGANMFCDESRHGNGVPDYWEESFEPHGVGPQRQIVIGKDSSVTALKAKFAEFGIKLTDHQGEKLLPKIRSHAVGLKRFLLDKELIYIFQDYFGQKTQRRTPK